MDIRTYRAGSMQEALAMVRQDLGPDAAVLHTRELRTSRFFGLIQGKRQIEVTASAGVNVPSRLPPRLRSDPPHPDPLSKGEGSGLLPRVPSGVLESRPFPKGEASRLPPHLSQHHPMPPLPGASRELTDEVKGQLTDLQAMLKDLCRRTRSGPHHDLPDALFRLFTDLIEADVAEDMARELIERLRAEASGPEMEDAVLLRARVARMLEAQIPVSGAIAVTSGRRRLVALVGPTGVGKTTTIAKLAANYRLKQRRSVGLITVDTYRIAAVEQLRTYADIIDLPMQVVSTPREMREAVRRMEGFDLILMDTAGRSPRDDIKIQELKAFLTEAAADEVHLVLSSVAGTRTLSLTAERFAAVGTTHLVLTKLDEATGLGNLLPVICRMRLPLSYLTNGQNVPDDIEVADAGRLARLVLGMEEG